VSRAARRLLALGWLAAAGAFPDAEAAPVGREPRLHPRNISERPSYVQRVQPAMVALRVRVDPEGPSAATLGTRRTGSGVIFDPRGYALTVSYTLLDAADIEVEVHGHRRVSARLVGIDFESGLGVIKLDGPGPWPTAALGDSRDVARGAITGTVSVDEDGDLVHVAGQVHAIRPFAASWEYMLDRAFLVAPASGAWSGAAVVDVHGRVVAIASLRLGEAPYVNLAIPIETFLPVKDELVARGRVASRPPRPWLGLYTAADAQGVVVEGFSPSGPARHAGFQKGDRILSVNGVAVGKQEEFYQQLWRAKAGDEIRIAVLRDDARRVITVRSVDRRRLFRTTTP
jgi:S1-C subfamily serine protease